MNDKKMKNGQVLLLVLLAMAGLATIVLSVVSRSVSEVSVTSREEESLRAFSAAEAGVEESLVTGAEGTKELTVPVDGSPSVVSTYTTEVEGYPEDPTKFNYPFELSSGESASVWFVTRNEDQIVPCASGTCFNGSLTLCWGKPGAGGVDPAVFVNVIYDTGTEYISSPTGFDANDTRRTGGSNPNNFDDSNANCTGSNNIAGQNYDHRATVDLSSAGLGAGLPAGSYPVLMRVAMLYNDNAQTFGVSTVNPLPVQGRKVTSEGQSGEVTRKIDAFLLNPEMPFIFDAAIYSDGDITK